MSESVVREKLKLLPESSGVYIMLDANGTVIYVGKARVLKNRVRQYFHSSPKPVKVQAMVDTIADFSYIVTPSEVDALALENTLIKKYKPKYNILLKDDKTYPYIKIHTHEEFPHISITRRVKKDGRYFGPFMGGVSCKEIVDVVARVYRLRTCGGQISSSQKKKPCLDHDLGRCTAPCAGFVSKEEYGAQVEQAISFLSGDYEEAQRILEEKMKKFAEEEQFELALDFRNKIAMLSKLGLRRITSMPRDVDADVWAFASNGLYAAVSLLITRRGIMQGNVTFTLEEGAGEGGEGTLSFLTQYYREREIPHEVILDEPLDDEIFKAYARQKDGHGAIVRPKFGIRRELLDMAQANAREYLEKSVSQIAHKNDMTRSACERLQTLLHLSNYPRRMECYDISDISGVDKVGSMVVFTEGEADKYEYRRFRIKTVEGANDFASMQEVLTRRLSKLGSEEEERFPKPQLIVLDGGKGQLSAVKQIFDALKIEGIDLIALAKQEEEIYTLDSDAPVKLDRRDYALKMLQRIRDEAHRFAVTYFRNLHSKRNLRSVLDEIGGVGKQKRTALMEKFGTIDKIMRADEKQLMECRGVGPELAKRIRQYFEQL